MFNTIFYPMLLKEIDKPFNSKNCIYELKYDGIRAIIYVSKEKFLITNRRGIDITDKYPELKSIQNLVGCNEVIFDGEIVAFDDFKPSFSKLSLRSHLKDFRKIENMKKIVPVAFIAFDIVYLNKDITNLPLIERKNKLNNFLDNDYFIKAKVYNEGLRLFEKVEKLNLEGIVIKEKDSIYIQNKRVATWLKVKNFKTEEFYIHGYIKNNSKYSLLLGEYKNNNLSYVGKVSVTDDNIILKDVLKLKEVENIFVNCNIDAKYVKPIYKIKVFYMERTSDNMLRQPFVTNKKA